MIYEYSGTVESDLDSIKYCLDEILSDLKGIIDNDDIMFDIRLILNELIINGAIHGNELEDSKLVKIDINVNDDSIDVSIEDEGQGIDYDLKDYDYTKLECCGRGLLIVDRLCDKCVIDKNKVYVSKRLSSL